jgi:hypothetical protein
MNIRITATYPATDGSMPESIEIDLTDIPDDHPAARGQHTPIVMEMIGCLMIVPDRVRTVANHD